MSLAITKEVASNSVISTESDRGQPSSSPSVADPKVTTPSITASSVLAAKTASDPNSTSVEAQSSAPVIPLDSEKEAQDKVGSKFAALSRKERQVVAQQQELKAEQAKLVESRAKADSEIAESKAKSLAEIAEIRASVEADIKEVQKFNELKGGGAIKALEALGYTLAQANEELMNESNPTPEHILNAKSKAIDARIAAFEKSQADKEAAKEAAQAKAQKEAEEASKLKADEDLKKEQANLSAQQKQILEEFRNEIKDFTTKNSDEYELVILNDAHEIILATVEEHYQNTLRAHEEDLEAGITPDKARKPEVLSIPDASKLVESYLYQQVEKNLATKKLRAAKVSSPNAESKENATVNSNKANANPSQPIKTLTNDLASASPSTLSQKTDKDRMARAMAALSGTR